LVNIGGEIAVQGVDDFGNMWYAQIEKPVDNAPYGKYKQALVRLNNRAVATSGNNRRFHVIDGVKYAHTIDVKTGYPVRHNLLSATIVADDCITADV
jgi:thiamine biosynthesis lipoprotein